MPFLPLFIGQLGVTDVGEIAAWPGVGPVIGGILAGVVGLRKAFFVTAAFYAIGLVVVHVMYDDRAVDLRPQPVTSVPENGGRRSSLGDGGRVSFRDVLSFQNFML